MIAQLSAMLEQADGIDCDQLLGSGHARHPISSIRCAGSQGDFGHVLVLGQVGVLVAVLPGADLHTKQLIPF
jgi:hypothetical protein